MKRTTRIVGTALFAAAVSVACTNYSVVEKEVHLRYRAESDALELVEIQRGLGAKDTNKATLALERMLAGARLYPPEGGLLVADFDRTASETMDPEELLEWGPYLEDYEVFRSGVQVEEAGLFLDDEQRLSFFRASRFAHVQRGLRVFDHLVNLLLAGGLEEEPFEPHFPVYDQETLALWREHVRADRPWLTVEDGALTLTVPLGGASAARSAEEYLRMARERPELARFFSQVSNLEVSGGRAVLTFAGDERGWLHFVWPEGTVEYDSELREALEGAGHDLADAPTLAELRARMR